MEERRFKEQIYELVARIAKAADSPRRLELLDVLAQGPRTVESLAKATALSVANASRHLQVLRQAGLVEGRKQGLFVEYRLSEELLKRVRAGSVVVLDVRPREEYSAGHIAGALSIPVDELPRRLRDLPSRKEIVAYCRGPYCLMAFKAVKTLRRSGRRARRLTDGFPEWRAAGLPVESSPGGAGR